MTLDPSALSVVSHSVNHDQGLPELTHVTRIFTPHSTVCDPTFLFYHPEDKYKRVETIKRKHTNNVCITILRYVHILNIHSFICIYPIHGGLKNYTYTVNVSIKESRSLSGK